MGVKETDTGLAPPNLWDVPADKQRMQEEQPLQASMGTTGPVTCSILTLREPL